VPTRVEFFKKIGVSKIAAGKFHSLALTDDETGTQLYAWGLGHYGRLGNQKTDIKGTPQQVIFEKPSPKIAFEPDQFNGSALSNERIAEIVCGDSHNLILTESGHMWSFGWNIQGQCGHGHTMNVMIAKIVTRVQPNADEPLRTCGAPIWISIAAGMSHSLAVSSKGTVYTCGSNNMGQLGLPEIDPPTVKYFTRVHTLKNGVFMKVFAGFNHSFALLDHSKLKRQHTELPEEIPAPEFSCERSRSKRTNSMEDIKDFQEDDDMIPRDNAGWMGKEDDENLLHESGIIHEENEEDPQDVENPDLGRYTLSDLFTPFFL